MFSNDIKERDGSENKMMTQTLFTVKHLEPCRVHVSEIVTRSTRKMCVCARPVRCTVHTSRRVQGSCHCLDAKSRKRQLQMKNCGFSVVEVCTKKKKLRRRSCVDVDNFRLGVRNRSSSFQVPGSTS